MNRLKILLVTIAFAVTFILGAPLIVNPILKKKILLTLHQKYPGYDITIDKVRWWLIPSQLTLTRISVSSGAIDENKRYLKGEIASVRFKGIKNIKALFKHEYEIKEILVSNSTIEGRLPFHKKEKLPITSTINVQIDQIIFDQVNLSLRDSSTAQTLIIKEGMLKLKALDINKKDTLGKVHQFDLKVKLLVSNSPDSLYTYQASGIVYSDSLKRLSADSLTVNPNYRRYDFTARNAYETDRLAVKLSDLSLSHFLGDDFYNSGKLVSSCLSIGHMDIEAFRDKRKPDNKERMPVFQQYIYSYAGLLKIDSMIFKDGRITYIEHADRANEPGRIHLNAFKAKIYNITNDTTYKTKDTSLTIIAEAMLMGKSEMNIRIKAKLFDPDNTFSMQGSLAAMEVKYLTPMLEKNAFIYSNTAKIHQLNFNFIANDKKATGEMIMLYDGLNLDVETNQKKDKTSLKEQIISLIANKRTWDSNPLPKEEARVGIIDYERDPTKFVFNYCIKSIESGVMSTILKHPKKKKSFFQKIFSSKDEKKKDIVKN